MSDCLHIFSIIFLAFTTLFSLLSLVTSYWLENTSTHHQGLWYYCNAMYPDDCQLINEHERIIAGGGIPDWHFVTAIGMALGCTLHIFSLLCTVLLICVKKFKFVYIINVISLVIAWFSLMIALSVYTQKFGHLLDKGYNWGYSFVLGWFAFVFNFISAIMIFALYMVERKSAQSYR